MKLNTLFRLATAGLLLGAAAPAHALDTLVDFDQQSDLSLFNYVVHQNASLGFGSITGTAGAGGGIFQSTADIGDDKHVLATLLETVDSTSVMTYTASFMIKYSQLRTTTQLPGTDYSTTVRIGLATTDILGAGVAAKDFFKTTPSFSMYTKFEHDITSSLNPKAAYMSLDLNGNPSSTGTQQSNAGRQKDLNFDSDTWYKFELTVTRNATIPNAYDFSAKAFDLGLTGTDTPVEVLSQSTQTLVNAAFSADTSIYSIFQFDGETSSKGLTSETFVDNVTYHTTVPEPSTVLLLAPLAGLLGRRRRLPF